MSTNVVENAAKRAKNFSNEVLKIKRMSENAFIPKRGSPLSAGYDLCSAYEVVIPARGKGLVKTDLAMNIPVTCYGRIAPSQVWHGKNTLMSALVLLMRIIVEMLELFYLTMGKKIYKLNEVTELHN